MGAIERWNSKQSVTMASGNSRSQAFSVAGFAWGSIHIPAGLKGNLSAQIAYTAGSFDPAHAESGTRKNITIIGVTKPFKLMIPPEWLAGRYFRLVASSAQSGGGTGNRPIHGYFKG